MSCLLPLIASICIANTRELRIEADTSFQVAGSFRYAVGGRDIGTGVRGRLQLSMDVPVSHRFTVRYGVVHESLINANDRGQERAFVGFAWRPL